jgi:phytoene dehydrogenase-like protein
VAHPLPDGTAVALYRDLAETAASLDAHHPGDGERWERFVTPYLESFGAVRSTMLAGFPPVGGALALLREAGPLPSLGFGRLLAESARALSRRLFHGGGAQAWLYGAAAHGDAPVKDRGSALAAFYLYLLGHAVGWPSPRGGAQRLADALVGHLRSLGGELQTGARVERVLVEQGRVRGVGTAAGERVPASVVLADVMPRALVGLTGEALASWYRRALVRFRPGPATVKVDWALHGPIPWTAPAARTAGTVHVGGSEPQTAASLTAAGHELPAQPFLLLGQQTVADPTRAPEGKHTAWAYTHAPPGFPVDDGRATEAIEAQVERFAPGFRDRVLARHVLGPRELERRNPNLVGGDVGGGSYRGLQSVFRPLPKLSPYRTPVRGLFLASSAAFPGGAVHGVPGDAAARSALRQLGVPVAA